jgi:DNA-binding XRE family transcriptional regulator
MNLVDALAARWRAFLAALGREADAAALAEATVREIRTTVVALVRDARTQKAIMARERLADWPLIVMGLPWETGFDQREHDGAVYYHGREPAQTTLTHVTIGGAEILLRRDFGQGAVAAFTYTSGKRWPVDVSAADAAAALERAARAHKHAVAASIARQLREGGGSPFDMGFWDLACDEPLPFAPTRCALVVSIEREVQAGRARPMIAHDTGKPHYDLLIGTVHAAAAKKVDLDSLSGGKWAIRFPGSSGTAKQPDKLQLTLFDPAAGDKPHEALVRGITQWRGAFGLRNWIAIERILSDAGRAGRAFWRVEDHMDALGVSASWRERPENRARVIDLFRFFASTELVYEHQDERRRVRDRILRTGAEFDVKVGAKWELEGIEIVPHPSIYSGVRRPDGTLGRDFWPLPVELAQLDHDDFAPAIALGVILPFWFQWELRAGHEVIERHAWKLLEVAGLDATGGRGGHVARVLAVLDVNLRKLVEIGVLAGFTWEKAGDARSRIELRPSHASMDRVLRRLTPTADPHPAALAALPATGADLASWRSGRGMTQAALATALECNEKTIRRAEAEGEKPLSRKLAAALRGRFGTGQKPAHDGAQPDKNPHTMAPNRTKTRTRWRRA